MKQKLLLKLKGAVQPSKIILILLEKHHELKSLISNEQISFPQPSKGTLGNNFPHFHVQFGAGMLLCEVGQQYGVIPHIGISSCLVVRGVFPQTRYVLG